MGILLETIQSRLKGQYISQTGLANLANYGYHGEDRSFFGNLVLKHWWNWSVEQVPLWFAPNLLTLLGLICNIIAYGLVIVYSPTLTEAVPRWVCFIVAFLIFMYQTLDNVDGKQARRTGSSSPLGELFDHGCDSITMGMIGLMTGAVVRIGGAFTLAGLIVGWGPFYLAHWEEYHTGILIMGKFNGPTEAQLIVIGMLLFTGIVGPWVWVRPLITIGGSHICLNHFAFAFTLIFSLITVGQNVYKVLNLPNRSMPMFDTALQLVPFTILILGSVLWAAAEYSLLSAHPHLVMMALSLVFAYLTSRLIVNRVCKEPTQLFHGILIPLFIVAFVGMIDAALNNHGPAFALATILLILSGIQFLFFSIAVIFQLTNHLHIRAFTITPKTSTHTQSHQSTDTPLLRQESSDNLEIQVEDGAHSIE